MKYNSEYLSWVTDLINSSQIAPIILSLSMDVPSIKLCRNHIRLTHGSYPARHITVACLLKPSPADVNLMKADWMDLDATQMETRQWTRVYLLQHPCVASSVPNRYLNQCWFIANWTHKKQIQLISIKISFKKWIQWYHLQKYGPFGSGLIAWKSEIPYMKSMKFAPTMKL